MITLQINGLEYYVEFVEHDDKGLQNDGVHSYIGIAYHETGHICISNRMKPALMRRTVAHEITHAYMYAHGFSDIKDFKDEDVCEILTAFAEAIFRDTDEVMKQYEKKPETEAT
jgi:Zn-dependent peptidase ImmA (M78 family)